MLLPLLGNLLNFNLLGQYTMDCSSAPEKLFFSTVSTLAYDQSFGFFDDIPDTQWKMFQEIHTNVFPNHYDNTLSIEPVGSRAPAWYAENFQEEFHCAFAQRIPSDSHKDGPKWVCDPHRISKQKECLIYSVGCFGNTMFEEGVRRQIGEHCEVHTFDVVTHNERNGAFQPKVEAVGAHFHHWGLGSQVQADAYTANKNSGGTPMFTLKQTMNMLNHTGRVVDIFKIDCEGCEWDTYGEWLRNDIDVRQILVETHNVPMPQAKNFFYALHDAGYVIFSKEANLLWQGKGIEYSFLKLSPKFFVNNTTYTT